MFAGVVLWRGTELVNVLDYGCDELGPESEAVHIVEQKETNKGGTTDLERFDPGASRVPRFVPTIVDMYLQPRVLTAFPLYLI